MSNKQKSNKYQKRQLEISDIPISKLDASERVCTIEGDICRHKFRNLVNLLPQTVFEMDLNGKLTFVNRHALCLFGYSQSDLEEEEWNVMQMFIPDYHDRIRQDTDVLLSGGSIDKVKYTALRKDGSTFPVVIYPGVIIHDNEPVGIRGVIVDISEQMRIESNMRKDAQYLDAMFDALLVVDSKYEVVKVNRRASKLWGYSKEEMYGLNFQGLFPEREHDKLYSFVNKVLYETNDKDFKSIYTSVLTKNNNEIPVIVDVSAIKDENGNFTEYIGVVRDITDLMQTEEALRKSEERYRNVFENTGAATVIINDDMTFSMANAEFEKLIGRSMSDIKNKEVFEKFIFKEDVERIKEYHKKRRIDPSKAPSDYEFRFVDGNGKFKDIFIRISMIPGTRKSIASLLDITKRKQAEKALQDSEKRFRDLADLLPHIIFEVDLNFRIIYSNRSAQYASGYSADELEGDFNVLDFFKPGDREVLRCEGNKILNGVEMRGKEFIMLRKDGSLVPVLVCASPIKHEDRIMGIRGILVDITEYKKAEEAIAAEKELLSITLRSIDDGVITTDIKGHIVLMNKVMEELVDYSFDIAVGKHLYKIISFFNETTGMVCESPVDRVLRTGEAVRSDIYKVCVVGYGTERILEVNGGPINDKEMNNIGVVLVFRDVTTERKIEEELLKVQKLESVATLSGGIAHDFNNLLMPILGNISLAKLDMDPEDERYKILTEAENASLKAKKLTQQLLTFAKDGGAIKETTSIMELLKETAIFALRGSNVRCDFFIKKDLWPVRVDKGQLSQVIHNLIINSVQAMPDGGIIKASVENVIVTADLYLPLKAGKYIRISMEDQGVGISEDYIQKIFDPFFTTKKKGSGLGLAISYSIIKNHNGYITIESEEGVGTFCSIYLPASDSVILDKKIYNEDIIIGNGKILLMEDEEKVKEVAGKMLRHLGYTVEFAIDGVEAIRLYKQSRESGDPFDAVIMDLTIPGGMQGKEALQKLLKIDPTVKAIVSTGYSIDQVKLNFEKYGFCEFVAKPYKIQELSKILHRLLS